MDGAAETNMGKARITEELRELLRECKRVGRLPSDLAAPATVLAGPASRLSPKQNSQHGINPEWGWLTIPAKKVICPEWVESYSGGSAQLAASDHALGTHLHKLLEESRPNANAARVRTGGVMYNKVCSHAPPTGVTHTAKPAHSLASEIEHNPHHTGLPCNSHDLGGKRELVVRLALESDREGKALLRVLPAAHSAPEVGRLAIHMIEDIHHRPDVWLDAVARPVLPRRHVDQQPAHGSTATATNLRASTAPTWSTRGPYLVDASHLPGRRIGPPGRRADPTWSTRHGYLVDASRAPGRRTTPKGRRTESGWLRACTGMARRLL